MKRPSSIDSILFVFLAAIAIFMGEAAYAVEIIVAGEGATRQEAVNNAVRSAVEQATGVYIKSFTEVKDFEMIVDKVSSASAGYAKRYEVIEESRNPNSKIYKVKIRAFVDDVKVKGAVDEFLQDPRAKRTFQDMNFEEKRVVVLYLPKTGMELSYRSSAVATVMNLIQDRLVHHAFRVFLQDEIIRIRGKTAELISDEKTAFNVAMQESADAIVTVSFASDSKSSDGGNFGIISSTLTLKAYDPTTGELFANVHEMYKALSKDNQSGMESAVERLAAKIGPVAADKLTAKIVERFSSTKARFVFIVFRNTEPHIQDKIEDIINEAGWKYKIVRQAGNYLEVELFSEADSISVRKRIRDAVRKADLNISAVETVGNRIVFDGTIKN